MSGVATAAVVVGLYTADANRTAATRAADAQREAARKSASAISGSSDQAIAEQRRQFDQTQRQAEPFRQAGLSALEQQQALLGLSGQEEQYTALDNFQTSPGQAFLRDRGEQALLRNSAAIGGLGGGNVRSELQQQGIGFAQQDLQNQLARLASIAGQGQAITGNVAQLGQQSASNIGNLLNTSGQAQSQGFTQAGQAQASGILGRQEATSEGIGQAAQAFGYGYSRL